MMSAACLTYLRSREKSKNFSWPTAPPPG